MQTPFHADQILIERARRGETQAFERIYRGYQRMVYSLALRLLGNTALAMDALQDSFVAAFKSMAQFKGSGLGEQMSMSFTAWLRQIVINRCLRELRDRKQNNELPAPEEMFEVAQQLELAQDLQQAFKCLPDRTRAVVWLYFVEGYSHQEIAAAFGQSVSFSKSQVLRGSEKLRAILRDDAAPSLGEST